MKLRTVIGVLRDAKKRGRYGFVPDDHVLHQLTRWARKATRREIDAVIRYALPVGGKVYAVAQCTIAGAWHSSHRMAVS